MFTGKKICLGLLFINSESVTYKGVIISDKSANAIKQMPWHTKLFSYNAILFIMSALVEIILYPQKWRWNRHRVLYSNFKNKRSAVKHYWKYIPWHAQLFVVQCLCSVGLFSWCVQLFEYSNYRLMEIFKVAKLEWNLRAATWCWRVQIRKFNHLLVKNKSLLW